MVLSRAQRDWLRALRDQLARERLAPDPPRCAGCRKPTYERTPGCAHCRYRHAARRRQLRRMYAEGRLPAPGKQNGGRHRWGGGEQTIARRRRRVAELTAQGKSASEIGRLLGVNHQTVIEDRRALAALTA